MTKLPADALVGQYQPAEYCGNMSERRTVISALAVAAVLASVAHHYLIGGTSLAAVPAVAAAMFLCAVLGYYAFLYVCGWK